MRHSNNRFGVTLAAAMVFVLAGIHSLSAQDQTGMAADADGIEPPDIGIAHELPVNAVVATKQSVLWPELAALLADADGIEPPNSGFAYALPVQTSIVSADRVPAEEHAGLVYDADGIEPPDIGVAYDIDPAAEAYVERRQRAKRVAARPGEDK